MSVYTIRSKQMCSDFSTLGRGTFSVYRVRSGAYRLDYDGLVIRRSSGAGEDKIVPLLVGALQYLGSDNLLGLCDAPASELTRRVFLSELADKLLDIGWELKLLHSAANHYVFHLTRSDVASAT